MDLTGMAISVIAYNEPKYLYVTLDALNRVHGVDEFPITVYFDGILSQKEKAEQEEVLYHFPYVSRQFSDSHLGILGNVVRAIRTPIERGAPLILYIEGDHLVRPDVLEFPMKDDSDCFFVGLSWFEMVKLCRYFPKGNIIKAGNAMRLLSWIDEEKYLGLPKTKRNPEDLIDRNYLGHDFIFNAFLETYDEETSLPHGLYLAHIGLLGINFQRIAAPLELLELEERMFAGPREQWLNNIATIMKMGNYPTEPSVLNARLWPRGFTYYGTVADKTI